MGGFETRPYVVHVGALPSRRRPSCGAIDRRPETCRCHNTSVGEGLKPSRRLQLAGPYTKMRNQTANKIVSAPSTMRVGVAARIFF
jgi:hypothetical protein